MRHEFRSLHYSACEPCFPLQYLHQSLETPKACPSPGIGLTEVRLLMRVRCMPLTLDDAVCRHCLGLMDTAFVERLWLWWVAPLREGQAPRAQRSIQPAIKCNEVVSMHDRLPDRHNRVLRHTKNHPSSCLLLVLFLRFLPHSFSHSEPGRSL